MSTVAQGQSHLTEEERRQAFTDTSPKVPRKAVTWMVIGCLVLGFGGIIGDHFWGGATKVGATPKQSVATGTNPPPLVGPGGPTAAVPAAIAAAMAWQPGDEKPAPKISLVAPDGRPVSLSMYKGKVVVLSFFDSACDDVCPVLEQELAGAMARIDAAGYGGRVQLLTVNTDPLAVGVSQSHKALAGPLSAVSGGRWRFLTSSIDTLNPIWKAYGVQIDAQPASKIVAHNDLLYFIDPAGRIAARATPFANEVGKGRYVLPTATIRQFSTGIADEVKSLARRGGSS